MIQGMVIAQTNLIALRFYRAVSTVEILDRTLSQMILQVCITLPNLIERKDWMEPSSFNKVTSKWQLSKWELSKVILQESNGYNEVVDSSLKRFCELKCFSNYNRILNRYYWIIQLFIYFQLILRMIQTGLNDWKPQILKVYQYYII